MDEDTLRNLLHDSMTEQLETAMRQAATPLAAFYKHLREEGVPAAHALQMTLEMLRQLFRNNK